MKGDTEATKNYKGCFNCLRNLRDKCSKTKGWYYCKGIHNPAICNKREEKETIETRQIESANKRTCVLACFTCLASRVLSVLACLACSSCAL